MMEQKDAGQREKRLQHMHGKRAIAKQRSPERQEIEIEMGLVCFMDWCINPNPIDHSRRRMQRILTDPLRDQKMRRIIDMKGFKEVETGRDQPQNDQRSIDTHPINHADFPMRRVGHVTTDDTAKFQTTPTEIPASAAIHQDCPSLNKIDPTPTLANAPSAHMAA